MVGSLVSEKILKYVLNCGTLFSQAPYIRAVHIICAMQKRGGLA